MPLPSLKESARLRYFTFFYLYVMQGIPAGFGLTAITNYLTGQGISSSEVGTFASIVGFPWVIQFIWGPFIDRYQYSVMGHRKHWVVLTQLAAVGASLTLLFVSNPVAQLSLMSLVFFTHSVFASVQDASVDAMAISVVPLKERGRLNACMRGGFLLGISFGAAALSYVVHQAGFKSAVLLQSGVLLFFTFLTMFIKVAPANAPESVTTNQQAAASNPSLLAVFRHLGRSMVNPGSLRLFGIIAVVYFCFSVFIRSFSYHLIHELHWPDHELSLLQGSWGSLVTLGVVLIGGVLADRIGAHRLQVIVMGVLALFLLGFNLFGQFWAIKTFSTSGLLFWYIADPLFSIAAFPVLMALCEEHIEGSQFTTYMALINFCDVVGSYSSGWALRVIPAPVIGFCCGALILCCLFMLVKYSGKRPVSVSGVLS